MDDKRRKVLEALIELTEDPNLTACWNADNAESLLRNQSSAEELRQVGASEDLILHLWPETNGD